MRRIHRTKLFVFLREQRYQLFTRDFQDELARDLYRDLYDDKPKDDQPKGHAPIPSAQLARATVLQAYTGVSDDEVIEATTVDRRWQLVLDCLDCTELPFSKATLVAFRQRLVAHDGGRRLVERTLEVAQASGLFNPKALRVALDSSPLWGAGKVEDTYNLLGHALRKAVSVLAHQQGWGLPEEMAAVVGTGVVGGHVSLKAALDLDWDDPQAHTQGLVAVLGALDALEQWLGHHPTTGDAAADATVQASRAAAAQVRAQEVARFPSLPPMQRQGVSRERRISIEDEQMRHGCKSRSVRADGY